MVIFLTQSRRIVQRRADRAGEGDEPILDQARRKAREEGTSLRLALRSLRNERRERARDLALTDAPIACVKEDGSYERVSQDPRWPFGVEGEKTIAPFGLSECGLPRTVDPAVSRNGPRKNVAGARTEARDIIMDKLKKLGCDPIEIMAQLAMGVTDDEDEYVKPEVRLRAAAELASMVFPRLRGVESVQRQEKTVFVIGVPSERPADASSWLQGAEGPRRIAEALQQTVEPVIEGEIISRET